MPTHKRRGEISQTQRPLIVKMLLTKQNNKCLKCKRQISGRGIDTNVHHIVPLSEGGTNKLSNLVALCKDCHNSVHLLPTHLVEINQDCRRCKFEKILDEPRQIEKGMGGLKANIVGLQRYVDEMKASNKMHLKKTQYKLERLVRLQRDYDRYVPKYRTALRRASEAEQKIQRLVHVHRMRVAYVKRTIDIRKEPWFRKAN